MIGIGTAPLAEALAKIESLERTIAEQKETITKLRETYLSNVGTLTNQFDEQSRLIDKLAEERKDGESPKGWCFYLADFSLKAASKSKVGTVTFIRDEVGQQWWHSLPEEQQEVTELYIYGRGKTLREAIDAAMLGARKCTE